MHHSLIKNILGFFGHLSHVLVVTSSLSVILLTSLPGAILTKACDVRESTTQGNRLGGGGRDALAVWPLEGTFTPSYTALLTPSSEQAL